MNHTQTTILVFILLILYVILFCLYLKWRDKWRLPSYSQSLLGEGNPPEYRQSLVRGDSPPEYTV